ncbi:MAG: helix-turn-helix transcriptional regulator [Bacteroidales bacterium]|nr:helix-turn-helix transcriptional regulator [Bacteroidales bacterium]
MHPLAKTTDSVQTTQTPIECYIEMASSFASMSYQGVYLLDLVRNRYIYMSDYPLLRYSISDGDVTSHGINTLDRLIPDEDISQLSDVAETVLSAYNNMPSEIRAKMMLYLNFHIKYDRRQIMVCHKLKLLNFDHSGTPHIMLGLVAPSPYDGDASIMASIPGTGHLYKCSYVDHSWQLIHLGQLSPDELTMLRLTIQGHSIERIAALMFKSADSIKFYRRQVFQKLNVKNITEAIAYATHYCLI